MQERDKQSWRDTAALYWRQMGLTRAEVDSGWPESFKPERIAVLQRPFDSDDKNGRALYIAYLDGLKTALADGRLPSIATTERVVTGHQRVVTGYASQSSWALGGTVTKPIYANQPVYAARECRHITAPAFAAWLAAQGATPSPQIQNWFNAVGLSDAPADTKPATETTAQRNERWLVQLETAQAGTNPPSDAEIYRQIEAAEGVRFETVKKAVGVAKKARAANYAEGNVKRLPPGKNAKKTPGNVWGHRIGK